MPDRRELLLHGLPYHFNWFREQLTSLHNHNPTIFLAIFHAMVSDRNAHKHRETLWIDILPRPSPVTAARLTFGLLYSYKR